MASSLHIHPASFRDPAGFMFQYDGCWYRSVQEQYQPVYDELVASGLFQRLHNQGLLIAHREVELPQRPNGSYKILAPEQIEFQTYPYEWCFAQLQAAALCTLQVCKEALEHNMVLKDGSAYNVFFKGTQPCFLDTLSFGFYEEEKGWPAFQQFCRHFLYPLLLMQQVPSFKPLQLAAYPDGIEVQSLLQWAPRLSKFKLNNWLYVFLPSRIQPKKPGNKTLKINRQKCLQNVEHLHTYIQALQPPKVATNWNKYYTQTILNEEYLVGKKKLLQNIISPLSCKKIIDLGCNTGEMSLAIAAHAKLVLSSDYDAWCIHAAFLQAKKQGVENIHFFVSDIMQPTPALGWANEEHTSFRSRVKGDLVMALALVHHLRVAGNVPWDRIFKWLNELSPGKALVEFVTKEDEKVQQLLVTREDIFTDYDEHSFIAAASSYYNRYEIYPIPASTRKLFLFQKD